MSPLAKRLSSLNNMPGVRRNEFTYDKFSEELNNHGYNVRWSKATMCPNREPEQKDHHRTNCSICDHNGFIYFDPIDTIMLATSFGIRQNWMPESRFEPGMTYFSAQHQHKLSFWDKVVMLEAQARYTEIVPLNAGQLVYKLRYPIIQVAHIQTEKKVEPAANYGVGLNGTLEFLQAPQASFMSVSYLYHPTYLIIDIIHQIRDSRVTQGGLDVEVEFPSQGVGKLDFLVEA